MFAKSFMYLLFYLFLFLAALGLRFCAWAFSSCGEQGLLFFVVCGLLIAVASRGGAQALGARASVVVAHGFSSCAQALLLRGMWDLPGPGLKPALAGGFLTTEPPGKSLK